jgi:glycogen operon protein
LLFLKRSNREENRDGTNENFSWNCGEEGKTDDLDVEALRLRQIKNFLTILFMSQGTPMILMGDEVRRTQQGNNNAYCQDNELSWFDWSQVDAQFDLWCFLRRLIDFTQSLAVFRQEIRLQVTYASREPHISWHGVKLGQPDWHPESRSLAFSLRHPRAADSLTRELQSPPRRGFFRFRESTLPPRRGFFRLRESTLPAPFLVCP